MERMEKYLRTRLDQESYSTEKRVTPSLTVSRQCGAGMDVIGCPLVDYLSEVDDSTDFGWALFNQGMIGKIIEQHDLPESVAPFLVEDTKFPVIEALEQVLNLHPSEWTLFNYSAVTIRNLCQMGNAIIVGRGGNFVTSDMRYTFHVRLVGSLARRVEHTADRHKISQKRAREIVIETDKSRKKFVQRFAGADMEDPTFYHLVVNTDDISPEVVARVIGDSLLEWALRREEEFYKKYHADVS